MNTSFAVAERTVAFQPSPSRLSRPSDTRSASPAPVESFQPGALADAQSYSGLLEAAKAIDVSQLDSYTKLGEGLSIQVTGACLTGIPGALLLLFILPSGTMSVGALGTPEEKFFLKTDDEIPRHNMPPAPLGDRSLLVELPDGSHLGVVALMNDDESENLVFTRSAAQGQESFRAHLTSGPDGKYTVTQASLQTDALSNMIAIHDPVAANPTVELRQTTSDPATLSLNTRDLQQGVVSYRDKNGDFFFEHPEDTGLALGLMADNVLSRTAHLLPG